MNHRLCADPTCPDAWAEHEAHGGRPSREPVTDLCADPDCPVGRTKHEAHAAGGSS